MSEHSQISRGQFLSGALAASAAGALALTAGGAQSLAAAEAPKPAGEPAKSTGENPKIAGPKKEMPMGKIGDMKVSRMLLGGNLLTHYTHSRDLKYVYNLTAHYNTEDKILETLATAEANGINTLSMHNPPGPMNILRRYRRQGGKIQWIICPTAAIDPTMEAYAKDVKSLVDDGCNAIYLWGVRADPLAADGKMDLVRKAVEIAKDLGVPSGVGCHDLNVVVECEKNKIPADFYIKTFHHHNYASGPKADQLKKPYNENPGYWCKDPQGTIEVMKKVEKPWIAFKVMAAGAIPPKDAFNYVFANGADFVLAGMFDFEIAEDAEIAKAAYGAALASAPPRARPWRG
ncbi:MAG: hypothetical protein NTX50_16095 [Candidatus Sumerlaeota bacterium]|nr:hypothetical protein [Candidatus Sumerlaeota bacterium]